jgi:hypothetical protein
MSTIYDTMQVSCIWIPFQNEVSFRVLVQFEFLFTQQTSLDRLFSSISCVDKGCTSMMASNSSIIVESRHFSFFSCPVVWRVQPTRCLLMMCILLFHLCTGLTYATCFSHIFWTVSERPLRCNASSNLNWHLPCGVGAQMVKSTWAWSDNASIHSRFHTVTSGDLSSCSVSISTLHVSVLHGWSPSKLSSYHWNLS